MSVGIESVHETPSVSAAREALEREALNAPTAGSIPDFLETTGSRSGAWQQCADPHGLDAQCSTCGCLMDSGGDSDDPRPVGWTADEVESLPEPPADAAYLTATQFSGVRGSVIVREADGRQRRIGVAQLELELDHAAQGSSISSWVGRIEDGRWFLCENQSLRYPCCRVYPSLVALALDLWDEWPAEPSLLTILARLGLLRLDVAAAEFAPRRSQK